MNPVSRSTGRKLLMTAAHWYNTIESYFDSRLKSDRLLGENNREFTK